MADNQVKNSYLLNITVLKKFLCPRDKLIISLHHSNQKQDLKAQDTKMQKYQINSVQSQNENTLLSNYPEAIGYITHYKWIVCDNEYLGSAVLEADSEIEALLSVPPLVRHKAKVNKVDISD